MDEQKEIIAGIGIGFIAVGFLTYFAILYEFSLDEFFTVFKEQIQISATLIEGDNFVLFAVAVNYFYEVIPQTVQFISISAITVRLLQTGFNPWILAGFMAVGRLTGQMILYMAGYYIRQRHDHEFKIMEVINGLFHKFHFFVFILPPWTGIVGDGIMLGAGHEEINPIKMIPILLASNYGDALRWIVPTMAQLELSDAIQN